LSIFFKIKNIILILFAAVLIIFGIQELIEVGVVNPLTAEVCNIKHTLSENYPDENPTILEWLEISASLLNALYGYNNNPSLLELFIYSLLLSIGLISYYRGNTIVIKYP